MFSNAYQLVQQEQDEQLIEMNQIAIRMKVQAKNINSEISNQNKLINQLDNEIDLTRNKLGIVGEKLAQLLDTRDMGQVCTVILLFVISIFLLILIFAI